MTFWEGVIRIGGAILALVLVLVLAWLLLRWMNKRVPGMGGGGAAKMVKVLDRVSLGKSSVVLLRVEAKVILVAFGEHSVEKLLEFDDPEGKMGPKAEDTPSFSVALKDAVSKMGFGGRNKEGKL